MSNYSKEAESYWQGEAIRFLGDGNSIPSLEDRVKGAFDAGVRSIQRSYSNLDVVGNSKCGINFPTK